MSESQIKSKSGSDTEAYSRVSQQDKDNVVSVWSLKKKKPSARELEGDHVVALDWEWVQISERFGAPGSIHAGPVRTLVAVSPAGATVAAESYWVCEDRIGVDGAAGQYSSAVFHLVVGTASLDQEAWSKYVPHVAVLFTTHKHTSAICISLFQFALLIDCGLGEASDQAGKLPSVTKGRATGDEGVAHKGERAPFSSERKCGEQLQHTVNS